MSAELIGLTWLAVTCGMPCGLALILSLAPLKHRMVRMLWRKES